MTDRERFEQDYFGTDSTARSRERDINGNYRYMPAHHAWTIWQRAAQVTRLACADICEALPAPNGGGQSVYEVATRDCAAAIMESGEKC